MREFIFWLSLIGATQGQDINEFSTSTASSTTSFTTRKIKKYSLFNLNLCNVIKIEYFLEFISVASRPQAHTLLVLLLHQRPVPCSVQFQVPVPVFFQLNRSLTHGQTGPNGAIVQNIAVKMVKEREKKLV